MKKKEHPRALAFANREGGTLQAQIKEIHMALFPEEYDHFYDSFSEARDRARGINPMNIAYVEKTNSFRKQLGFSPFTVSLGANNDDTYGWVVENLRQGREAELREVLALRARKALEEEKKRGQPEK